MNEKQRHSKLIFTTILLGVCVVVVAVVLSMWFCRDKSSHISFSDWVAVKPVKIGLPPFLVPVVMRVYHTYSPCLEEGGA